MLQAADLTIRLNPADDAVQEHGGSAILPKMPEIRGAEHLATV